MITLSAEPVEAVTTVPAVGDVAEGREAITCLIVYLIDDLCTGPAAGVSGKLPGLTAER